MRKQTKIAAIVSAAALLALGASMTSFAATGWQEENGVWVYYNRQGEQVTDTWAKSGEAWFYLNDQGEMATDSLIESNEHLYYVDANGAMVTDRWVAVDNENAGDDENEPNTLWYYFGANGKAYRGTDGRISLKTINGKKYAFNADAKMLFGWVDATGAMVNSDDTTEWTQGEYYFGDQNDGALTVGWKLITIEADDAATAQPGDGFWDDTQDRWFYFKASGRKQGYTASTSINGAKYAFDEGGRMVADWNTDTASNSVANGTYTADLGTASYSNSFRYFSTPEDGARKTKGWFKVVAGYYLNTEDYNDGAEAWYYADGNGKIYANTLKVINGKRYAFDNYGRMRSGLVFLNKSGDVVTKVSDTIDTIDKLVDWANANSAAVKAGTVGAYYFGESSDGSMKTGNQTLSFDDQTTRWNFKTASSTIGMGTHGVKNNKVYVAGFSYFANSDDKFIAVKYDETSGTVTPLKTQADVIAEATNATSGIVDTKKNTVTYNYATSTGASGIYVVNTSGTIVKSGLKKDGIGNSFRTENSKLKQFIVQN